MNVTEFKEVVQTRGSLGIKYSYKIGPHGIPWNYWYILAELTNHINFDCQFDDAGICKTRRFGASESVCRQGCCSSCGKAGGYLSALPRQTKTMSLIAACFDKKDGFWREGVGCTLPRKFRSAVCLAANCKVQLTHAECLLIDTLKGYTIRGVIKEHGITCLNTIIGVIKEGLGLTPESWEV